VSEKQEVQVRKRRSREEIERLTIEFEASGLRLMEFLPEAWFAAEHPATAFEEAEVGQRSSKARQAVGRCGNAWNERQQECTRCLRSASGAFRRPEDRGLAEFRFRHPRTTAQRLGEDQSSQKVEAVVHLASDDESRCE
jgi:hypothetical protein